MRRKTLILVSFLVMLYTVPMIFTSSYVLTARPAEQNTSKDFLLASDPWLFGGWNYRREITITGSAGAGTNYQVPITVVGNASLQEDYGDIRFTDDDGITELDYWLEDFGINYDPAYFWVEVKDNLDTDQTIYMYYGNDAVSTTTSNGSTTFIFYEDWTTETVRAEVWDTIVNDGSISWDNTDAEHGSIAKVEGAAGTDVQQYETDADTTAPLALMFRAKVEATVAASQVVRIGSGTLSAFSFVIVASVEGDHKLEVYDDDSNADPQVMDAGHFGDYHTWEITRDGTDGKLYIDGVLEETASVDPDVNSRSWASMYVKDSEKDLYSDWFAGRKFIASEPVFDSWGEEEEAPPTAWFPVGIVEFVLPVGWSPEFQFGYDMFFIALGLVMIPFSTLYLVQGGIKKMSREKLFMGLIIFVMGLGLLIGGVMP